MNFKTFFIGFSFSETLFLIKKSNIFWIFFDHFLIIPTTLPDHLQTAGKPSVDTPRVFRTISTPSPHLFRTIIAENLRRRCGNRSEMVRKSPWVSLECLFCFWLWSGSDLLMIFSVSIFNPFLTCLFFCWISLKMSQFGVIWRDLSTLKHLTFSI